MDDATPLEHHEPHAPSQVLWELADLATPWALRAAAGLNLARHIAAGHDRPDTLSAATGAPEPAVTAILGVLARRGVLEIDGDHYALTAVGELLHPDHPSSHHHALDPAGVRARLESCYPGLPGAMSGTRSAYELVHGEAFWESIASDPAFGAGFERHLADQSAPWVDEVVRDEVWTNVRDVVDLGGGLGRLATAIASAHHHLTVTIVETAATASRARTSLAEGSAERVSVEVGDFFESVPVSEGAYLLAQVLHDWDDDACLTLLRAIVTGAEPGARIVVVERLPISSDGNEAFMNLLMFGLFRGRERREPELRALLTAVGARPAAARRLGADMWLLEASVG